MRKLMVLIVGLCAGTAVQAADNGVYVGFSLGQASVEDKNEFVSGLDTTELELDTDDMGYKALIGVRPLDWFGVEGSYINFGDQEDEIRYSLASQPGATFEANQQFQGYGLAGFLVGYIPIGPVDLFAKAGLVSWDTKSKLEGETEWLREDGEDLAYGVGVQFRLLSLGLRAEYEVFDVDSVEDANLISVGVTYTFL